MMPNLATGVPLSSSSPLKPRCTCVRSSELHALRSTIQPVLQPLLLQLGQEAVLAGGAPVSSRAATAAVAAAALSWWLTAWWQQLRQVIKHAARLLHGQGQPLRMLRLPGFQETWQQISCSSLHALCSVNC